MDSTPSDIRLAKERSHALHKLLKPFVQRVDMSVLKDSDSLPKKWEVVIRCKLTPLQEEMYNLFITNYKGKRRTLTDYIILGLILNHPSVVVSTYFVQDVENESQQKLLQDLYLEYHKRKDTELIEHSKKMEVLFFLINSAIEQKEKILVFTNSLATLDFIEKALKGRNVGHYRLDGSTPSHQRQNLVNKFNSPNCRKLVFLISMRAGGIGLNLVGANRAVIFDVSWNPCHDDEAAARIFRMGQSRPTYIYRLQIAGTVEEQVYKKQIEKSYLFKQVVDKKHKIGRFTADEMVDLVTLRPCTDQSIVMPDGFTDPVLKKLLQKDKISEWVCELQNHTWNLDNNPEKESEDENDFDISE